MELRNYYCPVTSQVSQSWSTKIAKLNKVIVETASDFNLGMDEDVTEELLEVVSEELTNKELLDLEKVGKAEEEAREKDTAGEEKEEKPPKTIQSEQFGRILQTP